MKQSTLHLKLYFLPVLAGLALLLAACGSENTTGPTAAATAGGTATTAQATTRSAAPATVTPAPATPPQLPTATPPPAGSATTRAAAATTQAAATTTQSALASTTAPTATTAPASAITRSAATVAPAAAGTGLTMKAAYAAVEPAVKAWQADAVYTAIFNPPDSPTGIDSQGRSAQWYFETVSVGALKRANWLVKLDDSGKAAASKSSEDDLSKERAQLLESRKLPPIPGLIDTDRLMEVARQNGGGQSDRPVGTRLARSAREGDPLAFDLVFYSGENVVRLRIDAVSGQLVENVKG